MRNITIFLIAFLVAGTANAADTAFICKGTKSVLMGENIYAPNKDSGKIDFDLIVNTKNTDLYGYPAHVVTACIQEKKRKCTTNSLGINCECESDYGKGTVTLSRNSGKLTVIENFSKSPIIMEGIYVCERVTKKLF